MIRLAATMEENVITVELIKHIWSLLKAGSNIQSGIAIPSKKILGYAENVSQILDIKALPSDSRSSKPSKEELSKKKRAFYRSQ
jgi:hypothetical protein